MSIYSQWKAGHMHIGKNIQLQLNHQFRQCFYSYVESACIMSFEYLAKRTFLPLLCMSVYSDRTVFWEIFRECPWLTRLFKWLQVIVVTTFVRFVYLFRAFHSSSFLFFSFFYLSYFCDTVYRVHWCLRFLRRQEKGMEIDIDMGFRYIWVQTI